MEQYQRNNQFKSSWDNKPKREWKPKPPMPSGCSYYVEVRNGEDPIYSNLQRYLCYTITYKH